MRSPRIQTFSWKLKGHSIQWTTGGPPFNLSTTDVAEPAFRNSFRDGTGYSWGTGNWSGARAFRASMTVVPAPMPPMSLNGVGTVLYPVDGINRQLTAEFYAWKLDAAATVDGNDLRAFGTPIGEIGPGDFPLDSMIPPDCRLFCLMSDVGNAYETTAAAAAANQNMAMCYLFASLSVEIPE